MRILVVSLILPWPQDEGARMRAGQTVRALCDVGEVDLYCVLGLLKSADPPPPPEDLPIRRLRIRPRPVVRWWSRGAWIRPGGPPRVVAGWNRKLEDDLRTWSEPPYDLVWIIRAAPPAAVGFPAFAPVVVDLDDLEDQKALERVPITKGTQSMALRIDAARWGRWQRDLARKSVAVAVCSERDRDRTGAANTVVVPNGYESPEAVTRPARDPSAPPRLLLQGSLMRPPLVDAAAILAREVLPAVRATFPDARLDLVGASDERVGDLGTLPGVQVHGRVDSMAPFLSSADLVAVPMRWGSGTRIKILEAFAHGIPVVSSTIGCEGLEVEDGRHLLIADEPVAFAAACVRVLKDAALRGRLTTEANALYEARYRWEPIRTRIGELAREVAAGTRVGSGG